MSDNDARGADAGGSRKPLVFADRGEEAAFSLLNHVCAGVRWRAYP